MYGKVLKKDGTQRFANLLQPPEDIKVMKSGLSQMGFEDIRELHNPSYLEMHKTISGLGSEMMENDEEEHKTLLFIYYSGHGMMDTRLHAVVNDKKKERFPLETKIRNLATIKNNYIVSVFDCCREKIKHIEKPSVAMRGTEEAQETDEWHDNEEELDIESHCQFILTFGCPPTEGVPAKSTIARSYLKNLINEAEDGLIVMPTAL